MATIPEALAVGVQHHQAGRLQAAEEVYRQILAVEPNQADAINLLGVIATQMGRHQVAVEYIDRAIRLNGNVAAFHNNLGGAYRALGRTSAAVACFRRAVELKPDYIDAHHNLGLALRDEGKLDEAIACYRETLTLKPEFAEPYYNLGVIFQGQGKLDEAVACYRQAIKRKPDYAEAHNNLGAAASKQGNLDEAVACYRRALELEPDYAEARYNLGVALKGLGRLDEAVACYRRALELKPDFVRAHSNLGAALKDLGKLDEAVACYHRALDLNPESAEAHNNLGNALKSCGKLDDAIACYRRALELRANFAEAYYNLGNALLEQGKPDEAVACYRRALEAKPDYAEAQFNLGNALKHQGRLDDTIACYRRALELEPDYAEAHNNLGTAFQDQGNMEEAVACYRRALEAKPDYVAAHDNLLLALQYCTGVTPAVLAKAHAEFDRRHAAPLRGDITRYENSGDRHGRLRLGFVSPDLGRHPVGYFFVRVLESLGCQQHETIGYSDRAVKDELTQRFQSTATQWRDVFGMSDQQVAEQIRADRIDILFDLAGHTGHNRLLVFARKPAPIQITWIGYEGTTGLSAMDYLLADRHVVPSGTEHYYREQVLRMPDDYVCYDPPDAAPPVGRLPALTNGYVTFGSFNNLAKIGPEVVAVWAEILRRCPTARLVLKYRGLGNQSVKRRYLDLFAARGVGPQRLELLPSSCYEEYLAAYHQVDVALDPFPFSGGVTTCEALWMGVPVVTCPGETFASRHSLSHLTNVGLTATITDNWDKYVELAVSLADDLPRLAALRADLRERMAISPLCDGKRFAANLVAVLREVWERWVVQGRNSREGSWS